MFVGDMMYMSYRMDREAQARRAGLRTPGLCLLLIGALATGCAGPEKREPPGPPGAAGRVPAPKPPPFLGGAMALLLTNAGGFRAHAVLIGGAAAEPGGVLAGELIGWGGKLLFGGVGLNTVGIFMAGAFDQDLQPLVLKMRWLIEHLPLFSGYTAQFGSLQTVIIILGVMVTFVSLQESKAMM